MKSVADRVLLVSMPFGALERPALSLGLLKAHCDDLQIACDVRYLTFKFADTIGLEDYLWLCSDDVPYTAFVGEWLFCEALYGPRPEVDQDYVDHVLRRTWRMSDADIDRMLAIRESVAPFLQACMTELSWGDYTFVGFTSVFHQNLASLALASRVKAAHPDVTIAFGGANWEEAMGVGLQRAFPFADLVFSGEADQSFPAVLAARRNGLPTNGIAGVSVADATSSASAGRVSNLDEVPVPDFDAFFAQKDDSVAVAEAAMLLMETSRGCWWGERSHCTFCGLNGATMAFRSKSPDRVIEEFEYLQKRHRTEFFSVVDDIMDMTFFDTVLPRLAQDDLGLQMFWEVKANLSYEQIRLLRDAGVTLIQPGIEAINDHVLKLMRKGTTAFRNVELLKWCRELGVRPFWNLLYGFPGETVEDYRETAERIPALWHLEPPTACGPIRLDRFSPFHENPAAFGMRNVRPMEPFRYLYDVGDQALMDIAYYFEFDYEQPRRADEYAREVIALTTAWRGEKRRGDLQLTVELDGRLRLLDTRGELSNRPRRARIEGWKAAVYVACDRATTLPKLLELPEVVVCGIDEGAVSEFLRRCVHHRLMITNGKRWLGVAVWGTGERGRWAETCRGVVGASA